MNRQTMQDPLSKETRNWMDHRERKRAGLASYSSGLSGSDCPVPVAI